MDDTESSNLENCISTKEVEYCITGEEAKKFKRNLENPSPERIEIRKRTLKRAQSLFKRYNESSCSH